MFVLTCKIVVAGILLAIWPVLLRRSGLTETNALLVFFFFVLICVLPIAVRNGITLTGANWGFIIAAGCCSGLGLLLLMGTLGKAPPESVEDLLVIMAVAQIGALAVSHLITSGHLTLKAMAGFVAAVVAAILLM